MARRPLALVLAAAALVAAVAVVGLLALVRGDDETFELRDAAPGAPGHPATWATGAKEGVGTAYHDFGDGRPRSRVWFTLGHGVLTEVLYPDVSTAQLRSLQLVVSDGSTFTDLEQEDTEQEVRPAVEDALVHRQTNTARNGRYRIERTTVTDTERDAVLVQVTFTALRGDVGDYDVWIAADPNVGNDSPGDSGAVVGRGDRHALVASDGATALAVAASEPFDRTTVGFARVNHGLGELRARHGLRRGFREARDGNVAFLAELRLPSGRAASFTLAVGLGRGREEAIATAEAALRRPFAQALAAYRRGWSEYLASLHRPPDFADAALFRVAAMTLRAHEDKQHPGAFVASLARPWGDVIGAAKADDAGYRLIWSRDLYQTATALALVGDEAAARRAVAYLDDVQQRDDGGFPQNSWPDGRRGWPSLQLDEIAFPILLAAQLGETERYRSLVRPAAEFIAREGPRTAQERWEETGGYSPSSLAGEIAALVVAARMATAAGDEAAGARWLALADRWAGSLERWVVRTRGPLSKRPYYVRLSSSGDADDDSRMDIANGGDRVPEATVVDAGFLELVRLGIVPANDPVVAASLDVIDEKLRWDAPYGPVWFRYNGDRYGEDRDGATPTQGHPWPLLAGERGEYELALARTRGGSRPANVYGPRRLLATLAGAANGGLMLPEQVWDRDPAPRRRLEPGAGTGSATPLAWTMAQYLRLAEGIRAGRVLETPPEVAAHFGTAR